MLNRRGFLAGLTGIIAAPAIIRTIDLMPIKPIVNQSIILASKDGVNWSSVPVFDIEVNLKLTAADLGLPYNILVGDYNEGSRFKNTKAFVDWQLRRRLEAAESNPPNVFGDQMRKMQLAGLAG